MQCKLDWHNSVLVTVLSCHYAKFAFGAVTGAMTINAAPLAPSALTANIASPVLLQVPQVPAVHAVTLNAPPLSGSAATAVAAAVAQQELRQQQIIQQVKLCYVTSCPVALSCKAADTCTRYIMHARVSY